MLKTLIANGIKDFYVRNTCCSYKAFELECNVCLSRAEGLMWQNLFLVIAQSAIAMTVF